MASLQASMITLSSKLQEYKISLSLYIAVDGIIVVLVAFLQINTIQTSNALHSEATVSNSERINKKITKLSMRIMLLYSICTSRHLIMYLARCGTENHLNDYERSVLEFALIFSMIFGLMHSLIDAILFLKTNVKAKRFLKNYMFFREISS